VPAYNAGAVLPRCLSALAKQDYPADCYEVIVVDDGSADETAAVARAAGARVICQANAGPAAARNAGAAAAQGELLLFTDADCAPEPGWITALVAPFHPPDQRAAAVAGAVAGAKGAYLTEQTGIVPRFTQLEYEDRYDRMIGAESIDFIDTYSAAYRRAVFLANHGFDTIFPTASVEDQEFSFRLAEKGYRLVFVPQARVTHLHNPTLAAYIRRKFLIGYWKALLTAWHPTRLVRDSHTPQALKVQMALAALAGVAALTAAVALPSSRPLAWAALAAAGLAVIAFELTALPFLGKAWRRDRGVLLPSVGLLWVRAYALGAGFAAGLVRFRGQTGDRRPPLTAMQRLAKRGIDLLAGGATLAVMALPMAVISLAIKLDSPGPVIFRQVRIGQDGRPFRILKFRTMVEGAEALLPRLVDLDRLSEPAFKLPHDPRITRVGRFLRRWSLDELPQLVNVLAGEMSLVGPRPEEASLVSRYTDDQRRRLAVKPGMTGPMQVSGRGDLSFGERLALELDYIEHYSLRKDIGLLLRTIPVVLNGKGAY
jgi:lipopolysaccharide/colanic/teichoic acid biosynthesis glycosyltransferase/GT2 family glycosyltransferase